MNSNSGETMRIPELNVENVKLRSPQAIPQTIIVSEEEEFDQNDLIISNQKIINIPTPKPTPLNLIKQN